MGHATRRRGRAHCAASGPGGRLCGLAGGLLSGAVGTLAMDLLWYRRYRRDGGSERFVDWELSTSTTAFDDAGAPAEIGRRLVRALTGKELPPHAAWITGDVVHWATGMQWGALYGLALARGPRASLAHGLLLGPVAWAASYVVLPVVGVYKPIWEYDRATLARDLSAHVTYGLATAGAFRALRRR